jgi:tetratricopeptide (TPR) repeat protein
VEQARFLRVKELFREALELPPGERDAFVERSADGDTALAHELCELLKHAAAAASGFLDTPGAERSHAAPVLRIPGYELLEQLAAGASGSVWRARQIHPRREVAIKVLRLDSVGPAQIARFRREAQILAGLDHPGIARVIESGVLEEGPLALPWIALEFVHGCTFDEHARSVRSSSSESLELFVQVCEAVDHAHRRGFVHRDLKPSNVMVDREGRPRVIDFGIARASSELDGEAVALTRTGMLIGTLSFMAPEQARGERVLTPAADVYSLGAILYESLTGRLPIEVEELALLDAVHAVCNEAPVRLRRRRPDLPRDLETILCKALEKDPLRRYPTAGALAADLRRYMARQPILARRTTAAYRLNRLVHRNPALSLSLTALLLALAGGLVIALVALQESRRQRAHSAATVDSLVTKVLFFTPWLGFNETHRVELDELLATVQLELESDPNHPKLRALRAELLTQLAGLDQARGDFFSMRTRMDAVRGILERLASESPGDVGVTTKLSTAYARSGDVAHAEHQFEERDAWFERALELDAGLVLEHPDDAELIEDLGWSLERIAQGLLDKGETDDSICFGWWRLQDAQALVRREPRNWKYVYNLSHALYYVSVFQMRRGELHEAAQQALECVRQARILCQLEPQRREANTWWVFAHRCAARVFFELHEIPAARLLAEQGLERAIEVVREDWSRADHLDLLQGAAVDRVTVESGADLASITCGVGQRLERLAAGLEAEEARDAAQRVRSITEQLEISLRDSLALVPTRG